MRILFERDIYIRLSDDGTHLISTTRYGRFVRRTVKFDMSCAVTGDGSADGTANETRETVDEKWLAPLKKRSAYWASEEP